MKRPSSHTTRRSRQVWARARTRPARLITIWRARTPGLRISRRHLNCSAKRSMKDMPIGRHSRPTTTWILCARMRDSRHCWHACRKPADKSPTQGSNMRNRIKLILVLGILSDLGAFTCITGEGNTAVAQTAPTPDPTFDQAAAIAKLKERIKGKEQVPASEVFKNIQTPMLKQRPAAQLLAVMEFGYARSLGVNCTHCHAPDQWEAENKPQKQIAREMSAMVAALNGTMLKSIKNLKSASPTVNCTTCHRGEVKPALNLPTPRS